ASPALAHREPFVGGVAEYGRGPGARDSMRQLWRKPQKIALRQGGGLPVSQSPSIGLFRCLHYPVGYVFSRCRCVDLLRYKPVVLPMVWGVWSQRRPEVAPKNRRPVRGRTSL